MVIRTKPVGFDSLWHFKILVRKTITQRQTKSDKVHGYIHSSVCYKSVNTHSDTHETQFGNK